jgi:hypothetical protein
MLWWLCRQLQLATLPQHRQQVLCSLSVLLDAGMSHAHLQAAAAQHQAAAV